MPQCINITTVVRFVFLLQLFAYTRMYVCACININVVITLMRLSDWLYEAVFVARFAQAFGMIGLSTRLTV